MKRLGGVFAEIVSPQNLWRAWLDFQRGKRRRPTVRSFERVVPRALFALHRELLAALWRPRPYRLEFLREPKRRLIAAAPVRDRIVHHAIYRVLAPHLDGRLIDTTFACLTGRGSHRALLACHGAMRAHRFVLMLDVRHYFLSIDHEILMGLSARMLKEPTLLALLRVVVDSGAGAGIYQSPRVATFLGLPPGFPAPGVGLPIGNLTSQWWGNHYLSGFDHFLKRTVKLPHYQRYMDDLTLFADSRAQLEDARAAAVEWLGRERRLRLKHPNAAVTECRAWHTYLGHRVSARGVEPSAAMLRRLQRRVRQLVVHGDTERIERSVASYVGILGLSGCHQDDSDC